MFFLRNNTTNGGSFVGLLTFQQTLSEHKLNTDIQRHSPLAQGKANKPKEQNGNRHVVSPDL